MLCSLSLCTQHVCILLTCCPSSCFFLKKISPACSVYVRVRLLLLFLLSKSVFVPVSSVLFLPTFWLTARQVTLLPRGRAGLQAVVQPPTAKDQACIGRVPHFLGLNSLAACVPSNARTIPRRHPRINRQPEDAHYGGFGPELPCCPPMSRWSSRSEVDDSGVPSSPQWECLTVYGEGLSIQSSTSLIMWSVLFWQLSQTGHLPPSDALVQTYFDVQHGRSCTSFTQREV